MSHKVYDISRSALPNTYPQSQEDRPMNASSGFNCPPFIRTGIVLGLAGLLAACGGSDLSVRNGPQAVHPSGSFLANGTYVALQGDNLAPAAGCHHHTHNCHTSSRHHYTSGANDGSTPIID
jgi:hypothetical protein